jgi:hypothetical protein
VRLTNREREDHEGCLERRRSGSARLFVLLLVATSLVGCGSTSKLSAGDKLWVADASAVIDQLRQDETLTTAGGDNVAAARRALHSTSDLYALLLAYADARGCHARVPKVSEATDRFLLVSRTLHSACSRLQRAAALFTRSIRSDDPAALVAASNLAQQAWPLIDRARLELSLSLR